MAPPEADMFDDLLNLEDQYYQEGLELGTADGQKAGRAEGRLFGLEKGFDKFAEMGRMNGQACALRSMSATAISENPTEPVDHEPEVDLASLMAKLDREIVELAGVVAFKRTERLAKQFTSLFDLTDPATLSSLNTEESIEDFDERRKRAIAKSIMIEKAIDAGTTSEGLGSRRAGGDKALKTHAIRLKRDGQGTEKNIEDFGRKF